MVNNSIALQSVQQFYVDFTYYANNCYSDFELFFIYLFIFMY